jgi:hypothetical protein
MQITTQLLAVVGRNTKTGTPVWDAQVADQSVNGGKFSTFDPNMAGKASQFVNQMVTLTYEVKQNGRWTNYDLVDVAPAGAMPAQAAAQPQQQYTPPPVTQQASSGGGAYTPEVVTRITKLATLEIAGEIVSALVAAGGLELDAAGDAVESLAKRFYTMARSHEAAPAVAATPAAVAEAVNAAVPDAVTVGAQPTPQEPAEGDVAWN